MKDNKKINESSARYLWENWFLDKHQITKKDISPDNVETQKTTESNEEELHVFDILQGKF